MSQELKADVRELKSDFKAMKTDVEVLKGDVEVLKSDFKVMKTDVEVLKGDVQELKGQVRGIQLTLENEITRNISVIAEAHLDLNRKLDEALKVREQEEILFLRMNSLENEFRKMKEAL